MRWFFWAGMAFDGWGTVYCLTHHAFLDAVIVALNFFVVLWLYLHNRDRLTNDR